MKGGTNMTRNQIEYWNLQENKRHNLVSEGETGRHNVVTEGETGRHNVTTEAIDIGKLGETTRHNIASEGLEGAKINLGYAELGESTRHNIATELNTGTDLNIKQQNVEETERHNQATESIERDKADADIARQKAETDYRKLQTDWLDLLNTEQLNLSRAQRDEIQARINEIDSKIKLNKANTTTAYWNSVNGSISALAQQMSALARMGQTGVNAYNAATRGKENY